jgi:hypothetical protein
MVSAKAMSRALSVCGNESAVLYYCITTTNTMIKQTWFICTSVQARLLSARLTLVSHLIYNRLSNLAHY